MMNPPAPLWKRLWKRCLEHNDVIGVVVLGVLVLFFPPSPGLLGIGTVIGVVGALVAHFAVRTRRLSAAVFLVVPALALLMIYSEEYDVFSIAGLQFLLVGGIATDVTTRWLNRNRVIPVLEWEKELGGRDALEFSVFVTSRERLSKCERVYIETSLWRRRIRWFKYSEDVPFVAGSPALYLGVGKLKVSEEAITILCDPAPGFTGSTDAFKLLLRPRAIRTVKPWEWKSILVPKEVIGVRIRASSGGRDLDLVLAPIRVLNFRRGTARDALLAALERVAPIAQNA